MQNKEKILVILFSPSILRSGLVVLGKNPEVKEAEEWPWENQNLEEIFGKIKDKYKVESARVLLSEEVSSVLDFSIPKDVENERSFIGFKLVENNPGIIEREDWDFRETGLTKNEKQIKVILPDKELMRQITDASLAAGIIIEEAEIISVSSKRNPDPFIGIALKSHSDKKNVETPVVEEQIPVSLKQIPVPSEDKEIPAAENFDEQKIDIPLSEPLSVVIPPVSSSPVIQEKLSADKETLPDNQNKKFNVKLFAVFVFLFFIIGAVVSGGILVYKKSLNLKVPAMSSPTPTPEISVTPVPTESLLKKEDLKISILNGGGVAGAGKKAKEYLEGFGYKVSNTGNAVNYDYEQTEIYIKEESVSLLDQLTKDLSVKYVVSGDKKTLASDNTYDVQIILGKK